MKKSNLITLLFIGVMLTNVFAGLTFKTMNVDATSQDYQLRPLYYAEYDPYGDRVYRVSTGYITATFTSGTPYKIRLRGTIEFEADKWEVEDEFVSLIIPLIASTSNEETTPSYSYYKSGGDTPFKVGLQSGFLYDFRYMWEDWTGYNNDIGNEWTDIHRDADGCKFWTRWQFHIGDGNEQTKDFDYTIQFSGVSMTRMFFGAELVDYDTLVGGISKILKDTISSMFSSPLPQVAGVALMLLTSMADIMVDDEYCGRTNVFWILPTAEALDTSESWEWHAYGDQLPQRTIQDYFSGGDSLRFGDNPGLDLDHNEYSGIYLEQTTNPGTISFYWKVSSESNYDYLKFLIDGSEVAKISGTVGWHKKSFSLDANQRVQWVYVKDGSVNRGSDCGWVDSVIFIEEEPEKPAGELLKSASGSLTNDYDNSDYFYVSDLSYGTYTVVMCGHEHYSNFDLYVKWNSLPITTDYDAKATRSVSQEHLSITGSGKLYIMVHSQAGDGNWKAWVIQGAYKDTTRSTGTIGGNDEYDSFSCTYWNGHAYAFLSGPDSGDFDLYIKWGSSPTTSSYDDRGYSSSSQEIADKEGSGKFYYQARYYSGSGTYCLLAILF